jgi:3',5'-cyclic-AMP phosphodiesterase
VEGTYRNFAQEGWMNLSSVPLRIAQISDIHCGEISFDRRMMSSTIERINAMRPDLVVVAGDLTAAGYEWEFQESKRWIDQIEHPKIVVPGNHDSRNVGYVHFENLFGKRFKHFRQPFHPERAERLRASGFTVVAVDSSEPDLNEGRVGREHYPWIKDQFNHDDDIKIFVIHHHLVAIPATGRERNIITDAGDLLLVLSELEVDLVLSGHRHVPFFWGLNGILICNSGTAATRRVRGLTPPSFNEIAIDASTIKIYTHYEDGRRGLSVIRTRANRATIREAFRLTDAFKASNPLQMH